MAAIVRVKRRITEDPFSALVLDCKRRKTGNEESAPDPHDVESKDQTSTILKFAGTIGSQEDNIATQISKLRKHDAKKVVQKQRNTEISEKCRQQMRHNSHDKRLKVVNCYRTPNEQEGAQEITVVEIERETESSGDNNCANSKQEEFDNSFVYDLYVPENVEQNNSINYDDTYLSVRTFDDLVYEDKFSSSEDEESEDSNREDYWKNEYPDTEEESSDSEIQRAVKNLDLDDDLSSDEDHCWNDGIHSYDYDDEVSFDIDCSATQEEDGSSKNIDYDEYDSDLA